MKPLRLSLAGAYDAAYPRTDVLIRGCEANGVEIEHRHVEWGTPLARRFRLGRLLRAAPATGDFVLVPATLHHEVTVAKKHCAQPLIFDPLFSHYLTRIHDYRLAWRFSIQALIAYLIDRQSLHAADYVLSDTLEHKKYYCSKFGVEANKIFPVYVGYNSNDFFPMEKPPAQDVTVGFYGSFNPLQGVETIVEAAGLLRGRRREVRFELVGAGYTLAAAQERCRKLGLDTLAFVGQVPYPDLCRRINSWDICLGIFGQTPKARLVIPNKVYHYAGCGRPVITMDTPAIREVFTHGKDIFLCGAGAMALAAAIETLLGDGALRRRIAENGLRRVRENFTHAHIGSTFCGLLRTWKGGGA